MVKEIVDKYRAMAMTDTEIIWLRRFLNESFVPPKRSHWPFI